MFKLYSCKLRLGGSVNNEIRKTDVTAPEIEVYRILHGADAVLDIVETGSVKRADAQERDRLDEMFANPASSMGESLTKKRRMLADLFGHPRNPLPKALDDVKPVEAADVEDEPAVEPPKTRVKRTVVTEEKAPAFAE